MSPNKEQRESANADAESIVNQIKKLRAGTSLDDEDRINTLTNLQHLADQLLEMVRNRTFISLNNESNFNVGVSVLIDQLCTYMYERQPAT